MGAAQQAYLVTTFAGGQTGSMPATATAIAPYGLAVDDTALYIADTTHRIRKVTLNGTLSTLAGTGRPGFAGDGAAATSGQLKDPWGVAVNGSTVFIADGGNHRIRRVVNGIITTVAGNGIGGYAGDGGPATDASLFNPNGVAVARGNLYIADTDSNRLRLVWPNGTIVTFAGTGIGGYGGDGGPAILAGLYGPSGLCFDASSGDAFIADAKSNRIRKLLANGTIISVAGTGIAGFAGNGGPGVAAVLSRPRAVALAPDGSVYIVDYNNQRVRRLWSNGTITAFMGTGSTAYNGEGPATGASLNVPTSVAVDSSGAVYVADFSNSRVRLVSTNGTASTFAGTGSTTYGGDGRPATQATLSAITAVSPDGSGALFIADNRRVRRVGADGVIATFAGTGVASFSGDGGPASTAGLGFTWAVTADTNSSTVYVCDSQNNRIRWVLPNGTILTVIGTGVAAFGDGPGTAASVNGPSSIAIHSSGLLFSDTNNHRIRKLLPTGVVTTVAGNGLASWAGDNGPAVAASINSPRGVAVNAAGDIFVADTDSSLIRVVWASTGTIHTYAGSVPGLTSFGGDGGPATLCALYNPEGVAVDGAGDLFISDSGNNRIRFISASTRIIRTIAGTGTNGYSGDGSSAVTATFGSPAGLAVDNSGRVYVADSNNQVVRLLVPPPAITDISPSLVPATATFFLVNVTVTLAGGEVADVSHAAFGSFPCGRLHVLNSTAFVCVDWPVALAAASLSRSSRLPLAFTWLGVVQLPLEVTATLAVVLPPVITQLGSTHGQAGSLVLITGFNFQSFDAFSAPSAFVGGVPCTAVSVIVLDTTVRCTLPNVPSSTPGHPLLPVLIVNSHGQASKQLFTITYPTAVTVVWLGTPLQAAVWPSSPTNAIYPPTDTPVLSAGGSGVLTCTLLIGACDTSLSTTLSDVNAPALVGSVSQAETPPSSTTSAHLHFGGVGLHTPSGTRCNVTAQCRDSGGQSTSADTPLTLSTLPFVLTWALPPAAIAAGIVQAPAGVLAPLSLVFSTVPVRSWPALSQLPSLPLEALSCVAIALPASSVPSPSVSLAQLAPFAISSSLASLTHASSSLIDAAVSVHSLDASATSFGAAYALHVECTWAPTNERVRVSPPLPLAIVNVVLRLVVPAVRPGDGAYVVQSYAPRQLFVHLSTTSVTSSPLPPANASCAFVLLNSTSRATQLVFDFWRQPLRTHGDSGTDALVTLTVNAPQSVTLFVVVTCMLWDESHVVSSAPLRIVTSAIAVVPAEPLGLPTRYLPSDASMPWPVSPHLALTVSAVDENTTVLDTTCTLVSMTPRAQLAPADPLSTPSLANLPAGGDGVVSFPPFIITSSFGLPLVALAVTCVRPSGDVATPLHFNLTSIGLSLVMCVPPPAVSPAFGALRPFSLGVATSLSTELSAGLSTPRVEDDPCDTSPAASPLLFAAALDFPPITCAISVNASASTDSGSSPALLQGALAVLNASTHIATFAGFTVVAPRDNSYGLIATCSVGALPIPPPTHFSVTLTGCPVGNEPTGISCSVCAAGFFSVGGPGAICTACPPTGASCVNGLLLLHPNFYRPPSQAHAAFSGSTELHSCFNAEACTMALNASTSDVAYGCATGYTGPLCGVCDVGGDYALFGDACRQCGPPLASRFFIAVVALVVLVLLTRVALRTSSTRSDASIVLRITMSFLQAVGALRVFTAGGTNAYHMLMSWTDAVSASPLSTGMVACGLRLPFLARYLLTLCSPLLAAAAVVVIFALVTGARVLRDHTRRRHQAVPVHSLRLAWSDCMGALRGWLGEQRHIATLLFVLFIGYMPIVSSSLRVLDCTPPIGGVRYLTGDLSVVCGDGDQATAAAVAYTVLLLVGVGFPCALAWMLGTATAFQLTDAAFAGRWGFLFVGYRAPTLQLKNSAGGSSSTGTAVSGSTSAAGGAAVSGFPGVAQPLQAGKPRIISKRSQRPSRISLVAARLSTTWQIVGGSRVWWEALVLARKAGVVLLAILVTNPYMQCVGATLWWMCHLHLQLTYEPYTRPLFNRLETLSLTASMLTAIISTLLLQYNVGVGTANLHTVSQLSPTEWAVTLLLACMNLGTLATLVCVWLWLQCARARQLVAAFKWGSLRQKLSFSHSSRKGDACAFAPSLSGSVAGRRLSAYPSAAPQATVDSESNYVTNPLQESETQPAAAKNGRSRLRFSFTQSPSGAHATTPNSPSPAVNLYAGAHDRYEPVLVVSALMQLPHADTSARGSVSPGATSIRSPVSPSACSQRDDSGVGVGAPFATATGAAAPLSPLLAVSSAARKRKAAMKSSSKPAVTTADAAAAAAEAAAALSAAIRRPSVIPPAARRALTSYRAERGSGTAATAVIPLTPAGARSPTVPTACV